MAYTEEIGEPTMRDEDKIIREAEAFVRRALSHFSDPMPDEEAIKSAALKVAQSMRLPEDNEPVAA